MIAIERRVIRKTTTTLGPSYGRDRGRPLVVMLTSADRIVLRPLGIRSTRSWVAVDLEELYGILMRRKSAAEYKAKQQAKRDAAKARNATKKLRAQERRFRASIKRKDNQ